MFNNLLLGAQNYFYNPRLANSSWQYLCFFLWAVLEILYCNLSLILMRSSQELKEHYPLHAQHTCSRNTVVVVLLLKSGIWEVAAASGSWGFLWGCWEVTKTRLTVATSLSFHLNLKENICPWCKTNLIVPTSNSPAFSPGLRGLSPAPRGSYLWKQTALIHPQLSHLIQQKC